MHILAYSLTITKRSNSFKPAAVQAAAAAHRGNPRIELAIHLVHLLATMGAVIEIGHEVAEWLH
jgi:hypothetical protein